MAVVNILDAFGYKWAQTGTAEALTDDQWKAGWAFIGALPPSVEQFNKWGQIFDEKSNYLFGLLSPIAVAAGTPLTNVSVNTLRDALLGTSFFITQAAGTNDRSVATTAFVAAASVPRVATFVANGSWVVPAGITKVFVTATGGGGGGGSGGGGDISFTGSGGGGGGAGFSQQRVEYPVVPGQTLTVTIGAGGALATGGSSGGAAGGTGGTTTITNLGGGTQTYTGGSGGGAGSNSTSTTVPGPGGGAGWPAGGNAGDGYKNGGTGVGGAGGSPPGIGSGGAGGRAATTTNALPGGAGAGYGAGGGGGGGYYGAGTVGTFNGGNGAAGLPGFVRFEW